MTLSEARLFREIAQTRSITRAAAHCRVSQSAASQHLQEVEHRLGATLVDRSTRPLALTAAGKLYAELCRDVLNREQEFRVKLARLKQEVEGTVRVASIYSIGLSEMSRVREEYAERYPNAHLHVEYMRPEAVYEALLNDQADLGLVSYPASGREFTVRQWRREQMTVAVPPNHRLAGQALVEPADLEGEDFVGFDEELPIRRELDRFLRDEGVTVNLAMHFDNIQMIKEAVALGSGVSILPERTMQAEIEQGRLVSVPLHAPELVRPVGIVHRKRRKLHRAVEVFVALLLEHSRPPARVA